MTQSQTTPDAQLLDLWSFEHTGGISPAIRREYIRYLTEYSRTVGPLPAATTLTLRTFMASRADRWSPSTQQICRRALRSFYSWAAASGVVPENVAAPIAAIRAPEARVRVASNDIRDALATACRTAKDRALIGALFGSGARRGEIAALTVADVDLAAGTLSIARSKTGKPRLAPVDKPGRDALAVWMVQRLAIVTESPAVWVKTNGEPMTAAAVKTTYRRLAARAEVEFSSHDARRLFATEWMRRGGSETGLQAAAGWSSSAMVARYSRNHRQELAIAESRRLFG